MEVLGCKLERESSFYGLAQLRAGRSLIDIVDVNGQLGQSVSNPPDHSATNMDHFCVQVNPWDEAAIAGHLRLHGVEVGEAETRYGADGSGPSLYIKDPEGNNVELKGMAT